MTTFELTLLLIMGAAAWFWSDSFRAREAGIEAVRTACAEEGVQLLDETISLIRLGVQRNERGRLSLARVYEFEYTDTGNNRRRGRVHLLGAKVTLLTLGPRLVSSRGVLH